MYCVYKVILKILYFCKIHHSIIINRLISTIQYTGLSSDKMVTALQEDLLTHKQLLIERVICKTFTHYHYNVVITDQLRSLFTYKLSRMGKTMHKLRKKDEKIKLKHG